MLGTKTLTLALRMNPPLAHPSIPLTLSALLLIAGCTERHHPAAPAQTPDQASGDISVVVQSRLAPDRLSEAQFAQVVRSANDVAAGRRIWFLAVKRNLVRPSGERDWAVTVYFAPERVTSLVRRGHSATFAFYGDRPFDWEGPFVKKRVASADGSPPALIRELPTYAQVAKKSAPFGRDLSAPQAKSDMPFQVAEEITDDELVSAIDFIRGLPPDPDFGMTTERFDPTASILSIRRDGEALEVRSGYHEGMSAGIGQTMWLARQGDSYYILTIHGWVS